jgi:hypothetical protein
MPPSFEEILQFINMALRKFGDIDFKLLQYKIDEYAYPHRLACHLEKCLLEQSFEYDIDCDYNKIGEIGEVKTGNKDTPDIKESPRKKPKGKRPDIIVHTRGIHENNLLVIEIKKMSARKRDKDKDREKLKNFTRHDGQVKYRYGLLLLISNQTFKATGEYYENGELSLREFGEVNLNLT